MTKQISDAAAAQAFHRLVAHLQHRHDAQNIDLMGLSGFCRNCLADWIMEADGDLTKAEARELIHGMPMAEWKERHQSEATPEQLQRMNQIVTYQLQRAVQSQSSSSLTRQVALEPALDKIINGTDVADNLVLLEDICELMSDGSLCAMGGLTPMPVRSAVQHFGEDFSKARKENT